MEEMPKNEETQVRVSRLAMAASFLAVVTLVLPLLGEPMLSEDVALSPLCLVLAFALGVAGLILVERSGGKVVGKRLAIFGMIGPFLIWLFLFVFFGIGDHGRLPDRMTCGTNLSGLGKAMMQYANDYDDKLPCAGGKGTRWSNSIPDWTAADRNQAFGLDPNGNGGVATVSSSLYLLLKYAECTPKMFVCKSDKGTRPFRPENYRVSKKKQLTDLWDFGPEPWMHCSYSYHLPYGAYALTTSSEAGMAVAADRTPWIAGPHIKPKDFSKFKPDLNSWKGTPEQALYGNSHKHEKDQGPNVLYIDSHVDFEKRSFCGIDHDNIYTRWDGEDKIRGIPPDMTTQPADKKDSLLVHDPPTKR
jgi:hypothetical protein